MSSNQVAEGRLSFAIYMGFSVTRLEHLATGFCCISEDQPAGFGPTMFVTIFINQNHAMEISEFIGRTITLFHRVDSRIPQSIKLKIPPKRHAG